MYEKIQFFEKKQLQDNQFAAKLCIATNNKWTHILENISMYPPSTLFLYDNLNQQNILDGITPVLPSIFDAKWNDPNHHRWNFNYENSNRNGIRGGRGYLIDVKKKLILDRPKYYINKPAILKTPKEFFNKVSSPCVCNPAFEWYNNVPKL